MKRTVLLSAMLVAPTLGWAQEGGGLSGSIDAYFNKANVEVKSAGGPGGSSDEDGDGYGVRGLVHLNDQFMLTGEFQTLSYDNLATDDERTDYRVGAGYGGPSGTGLFVEYVTLEDAAGFGVHGRVAGSLVGPISLHAQVGYLQLEDDERSGGFEFSVGGAYAITDMLGVFLDYRATKQEGAETQTELTLRDIRVGARYAFGGVTADVPPADDGVEVAPVDESGAAPEDAAPAGDAPAPETEPTPADAPAEEAPAEEAPAEDPAQ